MAQSVTGGEIRVYGGNKGAREFSCGQRDLCRLSEAQPAGREQYGVKISKMCGKDVLSYGKDVFLFVRKQAKTRQAGKQAGKMCGKDVLSYGKDVFLFVRKQAKTRQAGKQSRQK